MKRDFLKELGLEEDLINKIMSENGKDVNALKAQIEGLKDDLAVKDGVIKSKNEKLTEFEGLNLEKIKLDEFERGKQEAKSEIDRYKLDEAIKKALSDSKAKNPELVKRLLKPDSIKLSGEKLEGLEEQLKKIKEENGYLFETESAPPPQVAGSTQAQPGEKTKADILKMPYGERA